MDPTEISLFLSETLAGRYRPTRHLASGGFAGTFTADDLHSGQTVAAKILRLQRCSDPDAVTEFRDEVAMLRQLVGCDCVVDLLDHGTHVVQLQHPLSGNLVIPISTEFAVMELALGSLIDLIMLPGQLDWEDRLKLFRDVVKGVHQMHLNRIVHRDVKSENVLVFGDPDRAKIADLGRSRDTKVTARFPLDQYLAGRGDIRFAPLECLWLQGTDAADAQARADLYLLGSLLFEIAVGVGITSIIANDPLAVIQQNASLPEGQRRVAWERSIALLRDAARPAYETFANALPLPMRRQGAALLRLLTEPDPNHRMPAASACMRRSATSHPPSSNTTTPPRSCRSVRFRAMDRSRRPGPSPQNGSQRAGSRPSPPIPAAA